MRPVSVALEASTAQPLVLSARQRSLTLFGAGLAMFLGSLDQTIVATAGPEIQRSLAMSPTSFGWITGAYFLASTVLVPLYGKLSDQRGRKAILLLGLALFVAGSLLCGVSSSSLALIASRAVQGCGAAALFGTVFAILADLFAPAERGRYAGIFGGIWGLASLLGPLVGGLLTDTLGWRSVFLINVPLGLAALALVVLYMPELKPARTAARLDLWGALWLALAAVPLLVGLSLWRSAEMSGVAVVQNGVTRSSAGSMPIVLCFALASIGLVGFVATERRAIDPILDLRLFRDRVFLFGNAGMFLVGAVLLSGSVFLPLFAVNVMGLSASKAGLLLVPLTIGLMIGNGLGGQAISRFKRYRGFMLMALGLLAAAFALLGWTLGAQASSPEMAARMGLLGFALGPTIPLYTIAVQNALPAEQTGVATSSVAFFRQLGATVGVTLLAAVFAGALNADLAAALPLQSAMITATSHVYRVACGLTLLAALASALIPALPLRDNR
jgi:EmrB/QacA subfamily drug resistance transporter